MVGEAFGAGSSFVSSVDFRLVLERFVLVFRWFLEFLGWFLAEGVFVCEDREDKRLLGGCFRFDAVLLFGDGDSGVKLRERKGGDSVMRVVLES